MERLTEISVPSQGSVVVTSAVDIVRRPGHVNTHLQRVSVKRRALETHLTARHLLVEQGHGLLEQPRVGPSLSTVRLEGLFEIKVDPICAIIEMNVDIFLKVLLPR